MATKPLKVTSTAFTKRRLILTLDGHKTVKLPYLKFTSIDTAARPPSAPYIRRRDAEEWIRRLK